MNKFKVTTIVGTRPEIIRLSRVISLFDDCFDHRIVHTGQNWDYELNEVFFNDLALRKPDNFLGVDVSSLGAVLGGILVAIEKELTEYRPDAVLVLGDTNSAISAIMARRMKIPVYHMEAGNRSFDRNVPEETNRRLVDHISDFNLVYTEHARRHLLSEGLPHRRIYLTGSPMKEVLSFYRDKIDASDVLSKLQLEPSGYLIASIHREENVDHPGRLSQLMASLEATAEHLNLPIILSTHPRTRKHLDSLSGGARNPLIRELKPFGFHDYNNLQLNSYCAISDSGTIAEESSILEFPAVSPRDAIERPEALDTGDIIACGLDAGNLINAVDLAVRLHRERLPISQRGQIPAGYQITDTSVRVAKLIAGTARLSNSWDGIREV